MLMLKGSRKFVWPLTFLAISLTPSWSQAVSAEPRSDSGAEGSVAQSAPESDTPQMIDSSSISDTNQLSVGSSTSASPSYLGMGLHLSGGAEGGSVGTGNANPVAPISSILGSLNLQKLRPRSATVIDYVGGLTYNGSYDGSAAYLEQQHALDVGERFSWKKTQLAFMDSFSYLHDGNFGASSFGGASAYNLRFTENGTSVSDNAEAADYIGTTQIGSTQTPFGSESFITNASVASLSQVLTRRSSISFNASYSISDYTGIDEGLFDFRQITTQASYNHQVDARDSIGFLYGYQRFQYTQAGVGNISANSVQLVYRHRIRSRLNLLLSGGPEVTSVSGSTGANGHQLNATAQASLQYIFNKYTLGFSYNRLETGGYGVFAGGNTSIFRLSIARAVSRLWSVSFDGGYAKSTSIETNIPGIAEGSYDYGFASAALQRQLGARVSAFASYQFNYEGSPCGASSCASAFQQHFVLIGIDWNLRPIHLE